MPPKEVEAALPMHPYAAKMLLRRLGGRSREQIRASACAIADLEWWTRGGADYPERVALTLAVRRAAGRERPCRRVRTRSEARGCRPCADARGARLLAGAGVAVQGALADRGVDPRAERLVLGVGGRRVAGRRPRPRAA